MSTLTKSLIKDLKANSKGIFTIVLLLLGLIVNKVINETKTVEDIVFMVFATIVTFGIYILQIWVLGDSKNKKIDELVGFYTSKLSEAKDWYYSHERLSQIEKEYCKKNMETIWVASSNLDYETKKSPFYEAIKDNLKEGISYYYIIPQRKLPELKNRVNSLRNYCKNTSGKIEFIGLEEDGLFLFLSNIVIYNDKKTGEPEAFKELQIDERLENRAWVKINDNNPDFSRLISKFEESIKNKIR
ncbi:hypothetical protein [Flagellimonas myxillae]|uniref:hypothetical protein n=1 Tax=Flagellimonas myxillae TaxID=2942214 RepID=UPI00201E9DA9|nr:hypothetical protein [Muricauda myxillae]MCL6268156.1 hypothetical protein [Muricauda myxillae]